MGKLGAVLFVVPTPIAAFYALPPSMSDPSARFEQRLADMAGKAAFMPSPTILIMLATASLIGAVLLLIGRETITTEE
ncbi:hypothetical protein ACRQ1B_28950 [Rhizobium panacihumi]|uniref:hypothetical protein n=1 Tax=Rhizobium panacihumi TaxID=2008450 RepID=UPI003D7AB5AF